MRISFGGVHAVDDVSVDLYPGEVIGLVGGNGAGKSTLIRALSGARPADSGEIFINGEPATIHNPRDAKNYGIETIYQDSALVPMLSIARNLFLGRELTTGPGMLGRLDQHHGPGDRNQPVVAPTSSLAVWRR